MPSCDQVAVKYTVAPPVFTVKLFAKHGDAGVLSQGSGCYTMEATGTDYRPNVITFQVVSAPSCPGCSISEPAIDNTVTKLDFYTR